VLRQVCRNVKRWRDARMTLRWAATAMLEAHKRPQPSVINGLYGSRPLIGGTYAFCVSTVGGDRAPAAADVTARSSWSCLPTLLTVRTVFS
jgi:hypothetical protein